ncbi:GNAT family N-acetyltransferase [Cryobacterium aureum]|uniref:GNAT family N-acetyltransferase n=1 Tax=Cryobacterium aureum TaxID=995037 RepID=UPI000CF51166|nr:GNAT family protein [Cryobacterium aureum]
MEITLVPLSSPRDRDALVRFLTENEFPFHVGNRLTVRDAEERIDSGRFDGPDHAGFWIDVGALGRIGYTVLDDLADNALLFDLRLASQHRGQGFGAPILRALTKYVFTNIPEANRFEGNTRADNIAMRKSFRRAGFIQEACYRDGWPVPGGAPMTSVAYAILRRDWESGSTTPLEWDDRVGL